MLTKPNILRLIFFVLAFAAALYYPVRKVLAFERPAVPPAEMRFRVKGYDPRDLARGHYLRLDTKTVVKVAPEKWREHFALNRKAFAVLEAGQDGFARVTDLLPTDRNPDGKTFIAVRRFYRDGDKEDNDSVALHLPFDRYYLNEKLAKPAEALLTDAASRQKPAVLVVDVYADGSWAVKDLLIDGKPIRELLTAKQK